MTVTETLTRLQFAQADQMIEWMQQAVQLARQAVETEQGAPFGAVIVRDGKVLSSSGNTSLLDMDPTAHAEIMAIRLACGAVDSLSLKGATLFSSCEPCLMCHAAALWAQIDKVYYAVSVAEVVEILGSSRIFQRISSLSCAGAEGVMPWNS